MQNTSPVSRDQLKHRLKEMILSACRVPNMQPEEIPDDVQLIGGPGPLVLDSLDALEIAVALERDFGIRIRDSNIAAKATRTVETLAEFVEEHRDAR